MIERVVVLVVIVGIIAFFGYIVIAGLIAGPRIEHRRLERNQIPRRSARTTSGEEQQDQGQDQDAAE